MIYQTYKPSEPLEGFIKCYWTLESPNIEILEPQTILPDGCFEMIFHIGDLYKQYLDEDHFIIQPRCFVIGQLTRPLTVQPTGTTNIFSIRFHPNGFLPFSSIPIKEFENTAIPLEHLFEKEGLAIAQAVVGGNSTTERIQLIEHFFLHKLSAHKTIDGIVHNAIEVILTANGRLSIDAIAKRNLVSRRQLERKFSTAIGLSPKQLSRIVRLQVALKNLIDNEYTSLTELAYQNDFYDQAHFIKDFKELTGFTPKEFYGEHLKFAINFSGT